MSEQGESEERMLAGMAGGVDAHNEVLLAQQQRKRRRRRRDDQRRSLGPCEGHACSCREQGVGCGR